MRNAIISDLTQAGAVAITDIVKAIRAEFVKAEDITIRVTEDHLLKDAQICLLELSHSYRPQVCLFNDAPSGTTNNWRLGLGDIERRIRKAEWHRKWREDQQEQEGLIR